MIDASLCERPAIAAFELAHWAGQPWLKSVAGITRNRLLEAGPVGARLTDIDDMNQD